MYNIYLKDEGKLELIETGATYARAEVYLSQCSDIVVRDAAHDLDAMGLDGVRCADYGVSSPSVMFSASVVMGCAAITGVFVIISLIFRN